MAFIQIVELRTSDAAGLTELGEQWRQATEGKRTTSRQILAQDRNDPTRYLNIVFFDSYEAAMENSKLPETSEFAGRLASLVDGPPTFTDLDVVRENS